MLNYLTFTVVTTVAFKTTRSNFKIEKVLKILISPIKKGRKKCNKNMSIRDYSRTYYKTS